MIAIADKAVSLLVLDIRVCVYVCIWMDKKDKSIFSRYKSLQAFLSSVEMEEMGADPKVVRGISWRIPHVR